MRFAALPLLSAALLGDPLQVTAVTAMTTVPWLLLAMPIGAYADRVDRVRLMVAADVLRAMAILALLALLGARSLGLPELLLVAFALGVGEVMFDCASFALLPAIVAADGLDTANSRLFTVQTIDRDLLGQMLGGLLYTLGRAIPLAVDGISFALSAYLLARLPAQKVSEHGQSSLRADVLDAIRYILRDRLLIALTVSGGLINFVYLGQVAILVLLVRDVLGLGPVSYAALLAAGALGGVLSGLTADRIVAKFGRAATLIGGLALMGLSGIGAALATTPTTFLGYFAMGFGLMLWNVVSVSLRQKIVPSEMLGRTIGAYRLVAWGAMPAGAVAFGAMARVLSIPGAFGVGSVLVLALVVLLATVLRHDHRLTEKHANDHGTPH